jgi:hypothetical protein
MLGTLEHMFHLESVLEKVRNLLTESGHLYVLIPTEGGFAWGLARRLFTVRPHGRLVGLSSSQYLDAMKVEHCNTVFAIDSAIRKYFRVEKASHWPLRIGGARFNLSKNYRLSPL